MTPYITAIVLAAGSGSRMKSATKKQYMDLCGQPLICYSLREFEHNQRISSVVLVVPKGDLQFALDLCLDHDFRKVANIVEGGDQRFRSVYNGLKAVPKETEFVLIHDGARPMIDQNLINRMCLSLMSFRACVAAVPVKDTIKVVDSHDNAVETLDRSKLWQVQTPQAFSYSLLMDAYDKLFKMIAEYHSDESKITDDAVIVENMTKYNVRMVMGDYRNIKVTTPEDMIIARAFIEERRNIQRMYDLQRERLAKELIANALREDMDTLGVEMEDSPDDRETSVDSISHTDSAQLSEDEKPGDSTDPSEEE